MQYNPTAEMRVSATGRILPHPIVCPALRRLQNRAHMLTAELFAELAVSSPDGSHRVPKGVAKVKGRHQSQGRGASDIPRAAGRCLRGETAARDFVCHKRFSLVTT